MARNQDKLLVEANHAFIHSREKLYFHFGEKIKHNDSMCLCFCQSKLHNPIRWAETHDNGKWPVPRAAWAWGGGDYCILVSFNRSLKKSEKEAPLALEHRRLVRDTPEGSSYVTLWNGVLSQGWRTEMLSWASARRCRTMCKSRVFTIGLSVWSFSMM